MLRRHKFIVMLFLVIRFPCLYCGASAEGITVNVAMDSLNVSMRERIKLEFEQQNPHITLNIVPSKSDIKIITDLSTKDDSVDIYCISTKYGALMNIADKQMYVDLSDIPEVSLAINRMYQQYQELFRSDSKIVAYPYQVYFEQVFCWDMNVVNMLDIEREELPTTLEDIMELQYEMQLNQDHDFKNDYSIVYTGAIKAFLHPLLIAYKNYSLLETATISYDTELFRKLLALEEKTSQAQSRPIPDNDGGPECIALYIGKGDSEMIVGTGVSQVAAISLDSSTVPVFPIYMNCLFINPYSQHIDESKQIISTLISYQPPIDRMLMIPSEQKPIENPEYIEGLIERQNALKECQLALEKSPPEAKAGLEDIITEYKNDIEEWKKHSQYIVTQESLNKYLKEIQPNIIIKGKSPYDSQNVDQAIFSVASKYDHQEIEADLFINELERIIWLITMENK